jgi:hypothetical protein
MNMAMPNAAALIEEPDIEILTLEEKKDDD